MQRTFTFFLLLLIANTLLLAQNSTWYTNVSSQVGLATTPPALRLNITDINGDKYPDIVSVENVNQRNMIHVYLNLQDTNSTNPMDRMFVDWTDSSRANVHPLYPDSTRRAEIVTLGDIDNDGDADMISGTWYWDPTALNFPNDRPSVLLNDGTGRFTHVPNNGFDALGQISIGGFSLLDFNFDGNLDVFVATFSDDHQNNVFHEDLIMVGNGDGTFFKRQSPFDFNTVKEPMYGSSVTDWDNDCYPDIFTSPYCRSTGNLWRNISGAAFQDVASTANYSSQHMHGDVDQNGPRDLCQWGVYPYDFDNDGDMDVFQALVHGGIDSAEGRSTIAVNGGPSNAYTLDWELDRLHRNNPQSFHLGNMDASWMDINSDGLVDLVVTETEYVPATDRGFWYIQDSTHYFDDKTQALNLLQYRPHTLEAVDYDLDGDYDIIMNDRNNGTQIRVLRNNIGIQNNWVGVELQAPAGCNLDAIGARIQVFSGGVVQMREIQAGVGHWGGQAPKLALFGLGANSTIDSIVVRWPMMGCMTTAAIAPSINEVHTIDANGLVIANAEPEDENLQVWPNPSNGIIHVRLTSAIPQNAILEAYDQLGRKVNLNSQSNDSNSWLVNFESQANGLYILRLIDAQGKIIGQRKLIISR